jgi:hypothetical protein
MTKRKPSVRTPKFETLCKRVQLATLTLRKSVLTAMRQDLVSFEQSALLNDQIASLDSTLQVAFPRPMPIIKSEARLPF